MKFAILFAALLPVFAQAEEAFIYPVGNVQVGQVISRPFPTTLFLHTPCSLPLADAKNYRHYASFRGVWDIGCWAQTVNGDALIVVPQMAPKTISLSVLPRADVQASGETTILALPSYGR